MVPQFFLVSSFFFIIVLFSLYFSSVFNFHGISWGFMDLHWISWIFMSCHVMFGCVFDFFVLSQKNGKYFHFFFVKNQTPPTISHVKNVDVMEY